jgi:transposase
MTIQLQLTSDVLKEVHYHRYNHPSPLVQRRMEAIWLKGHNLPHGQIADLVGVTENTIRDYFDLYAQGGVEKLKELNYSGELRIHISSLEAYFREHPPASIKEAQSKIETITGVKRSETQVAEFLKKNSIYVVAK